VKELGVKKILVVTDPGIESAGLLEIVKESLEKFELEYDVFNEVEPNPFAETVHKGVELVKKFNSEAVLAVGGGSSIDTAKGIAIMATNPGSILDYEGVGKIKNPPYPIIAIPTTAGTGSEITNSTVVTNRETSFKLGVLGPLVFPTVAILDSYFIINLPQGITAATGMDALTHAIESYTSKTSNMVSEALAIHAVKVIGENLLKTYFVGTDIESREKMLVASMMAGMAFSQSRLGNVHAISHTLGGVFNIPHGIANAVMLPYVMRFNLPACPERYRDIAIALGADVTNLSTKQAAEKAIETVVEMNRTMNIPLSLKDLDVNLEYLPKLVNDAMRSGNVYVNPRLTRPEDIQHIIEKAYNGDLS
jgi:alcohol dehydrogenase class IV